MGKKKRGNKVYIVLWQTIKELMSAFKYGLIEELDKVAVVIQILIPVMIARTDLGVIGMIVVSCVLVACTKYIKEVGYKLNHVTERGFPIPLQRFTHQDENGFISIREDETQEAILYMYDVEEYLKSKGWLK